LAKILGIIGGGRRNGYTSFFLKESIQAAQTDGVETEIIYLPDYAFTPCISCFSCLRNPQHTCVRNDEFGKNGKGEIFQKVTEANAIIIADPVHLSGASAQTHMFFERCYPFLWSGLLNGMPIASISVASNKGMHINARRDICRWSYAFSMKYLMGVALHTAYGEEKNINAVRELGQIVSKAAKADARDGRISFTVEDCFKLYSSKPWNAFQYNLENLTDGLFTWEDSIIQKAKEHVKKPDALKLLASAEKALDIAVESYQKKQEEEAAKHLAEARTVWAEATLKEFLEDDIFKV